MLSKLRNIFPNQSEKYPNDFIKMIDVLYSEENYNQENIDFLWKAYKFSKKAHDGQLRHSGEPYFSHCISVGITLAKWNLDENTIAAGLLHDTLEDTKVTKKDIIDNFNEEILNLVEGVSKLSGIKFKSRQQKQAENFMKMFLSIANDIRVIIIKFADRLHNLETISHLPNIKQSRIAMETRDVFAPLAHRLGMNSVKVKFENLVLSILEPDAFKLLKKKIKATEKQRKKYIEKFSEPIIDKLKSFNIEAKTLGRAKHYYSIHGKMVRRNKSFEELYDLFAIRIIVGKVEECYAALGVVHQIYTPLQERFKDYIATPKSNGYQSVHTTVFGHSEKLVEVQIRTHDMDKTAEIGVAAHWLYKSTNSSNSLGVDNRHMRWLRELVEVLQSEKKDAKEFFKLLKIDLFKDELFLFTPQGEVFQLPNGSTPVDFAFQVHTQVGIKCTQAKVNGKIVPLNASLKNGDTVEIITSNKHEPNNTWLKFVKTAKAKYHIKKIFKKKQREESINLGKEIVEKDLRRIGKLSILDSLKKNPQELGYNDVNLVFSYIASGKITLQDILNKFSPETDIEELKKNDDNFETLTERFLRKARGTAKGVSVDGVSNALIIFGKCCSPIPGDEIVGYITRGRGVTIHRHTCRNVSLLESEQRFINVEWNVSKNSRFVVRLKIMAEDRKNLLKDITESISLLDINITSIDMKAHEGIGTCILIIESRDTHQLDRLKKKLKLVQNLISVERI